MTLGKILFWGGITGLVITLIFFIAALLYLKRRRKKLQENLERDY